MGQAMARAWQIKYSADEGIVMVEVSGTVNRDDLMTMLAAGIATAREHNIKQILIDGRQATIAASPTKLFALPRLLHEQGLTRGHRVAIVIPGSPEPDEDFRFLETVFYNRGFSLRLHPEMAQALAWLKQTPSLLTQTDTPEP